MSASKRIGSIHDTKDKKGSRSCNCKRSSCLKLYCECFANGSYCQSSKCNCNSCHNNAENNHIRKVAIESTLERNPHAFRSKIFIAEKSGGGGDTSTKHHKGCHCKKSNCLKKYCECFQGGVVCSEKCRCLECRNFTGSAFRQDAIHRAQLKEKHGDADIKSSDHTVESDLRERRPPHTKLLSFKDKDNIAHIVQNLINATTKSSSVSKRKYDKISSEDSESSNEHLKITLLENYISFLQEIVSNSSMSDKVTLTNPSQFSGQNSNNLPV